MTQGKHLNRPENINCDQYTQADFVQDNYPDLFDVTHDYWDFIQDGINKEYMVYGHPITSHPGPTFEMYDPYQGKVRRFLNFCSYNYLGYSLHSEVIKAVQEAIAKYGTGAVSAPLLSGYYDITRKLENELAAFKNQEAAMVFPTGYAANLGILSALLSNNDVAVLDMLSHASIYDGAILAGAERRIFAHNNPHGLERTLKSMPSKRKLVCVEGVYSMDGDLANLPELIPICKKYDAKILVDEAHASLIFGKRGAGVSEHFNLEDDVDITIGTFSKSFGAIGGFAAGNEKLIRYLRMYARSYFFSCAMAPHTSAGLLKVLELAQKDPSPREQLWENTRYMWQNLTSASLDIGNTKSHVVPIMAGNDLRLREISRRIMQRGLHTGVITFPAVPKNKTRLRLSISALHTKEQMDQATEIITDVFHELRDWEPPKSTTREPVKSSEVV
jgi:8-amino-7-oxononanoate synthase